MRILSSIIIAVILSSFVFAQSMHGSLKIDCSKCHESTTWSIKETIEFNHDETSFRLTGQHKNIKCKSCHVNLVFSEVKSDCFFCHKDIHQNSVGFNCQRCHSPETWIVKDIQNIHRLGRFPLIGSHQQADCIQCHLEYSSLNFRPIGISCYSCHSTDYLSTKNPNHPAAKFSTDCQQCHNLNERLWSAKSFSHEFFPLSGVHKIDNCFSCHKQNNNFNGLNKDCITCHQANYKNTVNPNHQALIIPTNCESCHSTNNPGWKPASFPVHNNYYQLQGAHASIANNCATCHNGNYNNTAKTCVGCHQQNYNNTSNPPHQTNNFGTDCQSCHTQTSWKPANFNHDQQFFPINSGAHNGKWNNCSDCHITASNYQEFSCINCHEHNKADMDNKHSSISGYLYASAQCFTCHPRGTSEGAFNHATSSFPLTGAHVNTNCSDCHKNGYSGTPTACVSCHQDNYNSTTNPNHTTIALSTVCQTCHTTNPLWKPASFPVHNNYYQLQGAHASIANNCVTCHNGNYNNMANNCFGCHANDFNSAANPNHVAPGFSHDCVTCHTQSVWVPSTFQHDIQYFPIYSGKHRGRWTLCSQCHLNPSSYSEFTCTTSCHSSSETNNDHKEVSGYTYQSNACYNCHPTGTNLKLDHPGHRPTLSK